MTAEDKIYLNDVLAAMALVMLEGDALRESAGLPPHGTKREFTLHELNRGRSMGPACRHDDECRLVVTLES